MGDFAKYSCVPALPINMLVERSPVGGEACVTETIATGNEMPSATVAFVWTLTKFGQPLQESRAFAFGDPWPRLALQATSRFREPRLQYHDGDSTLTVAK